MSGKRIMESVAAAIISDGVRYAARRAAEWMEKRRTDREAARAAERVRVKDIKDTAKEDDMSIKTDKTEAAKAKIKETGSKKIERGQIVCKCQPETSSSKKNETLGRATLDQE